MATKGTFTALDPESKIFLELKNQPPEWWKLFTYDPELYIDIRKDNYINVYYYGSSVAKIEFKKDFIATTHQKYLGDNTPCKKNKKGNDIFKYIKIDLSTIDKNKISEIKRYIENDYLHLIDSEKVPENWIQGKLIKENFNYIDSEFQFNQNSKIGKLRIDLTELSNSVLSFVEIKRIFDGRLSKSESNTNTPEIIKQMKKYKEFIERYEDEIKDYYKKLIEIKRNLGLIKVVNSDFTINKTPKLIIADTYTKITEERVNRIKEINQLLEQKKIDYKIIKWK